MITDVGSEEAFIMLLRTTTKRSRRSRHPRSNTLMSPERLEGRVALSTNSVTFAFTGQPQSWVIPNGVQSALVTLIGGTGGADSAQDNNGGAAAQVQGTFTWPSDTGIITAWVGSAGSDGNQGTPGAGGWNGGAAGGTGSWSPGASLSGGGGGGATDIRIDGYLPDTRVMVAGGGGGGGGDHQAGSGQGFIAGGAGGSAGVGTPTGGVFAAANGGSAGGKNGGDGGAGGVNPSGNGSLGNAAGTGTGNAGGGGGGGGWYGGEGGQAGQAGILGYAAAAGGGGGGSSYADAMTVTNATAKVAAAGAAPSATIQWVDIVTTSLPQMSAGVPVTVQLNATFPSPANPITWQVSRGSLPDGLTLTSTGLLSGLPTRGQVFSFTVSASAGPGTLATSTRSFSGDVRSSTVPSAPTSVTASGGTNTATVSWQAPGFDGGSALVNYVIGWSSDNGQSWNPWASVPASQTSYTGSLPAGATYVFQVSAVNQTTVGPPSAPSNAVAIIATPTAPLNVSGVPGYELVNLAWSPPASTNGAAITGYFIRYSTDGGGSWAQMPNTGSTATTATVSGLTSQLGYIFEVAAINAAGTGPWSQPSSVVQPLLDPGAATDVVGTPAYQAVALTWLPPANTAIPVTGYVVRVSDDGGSTWRTPLATGSTATQFTYPGLTQPVPVVFQVAAVNGNGQGAWSTASAPVTPDTVPAAPSGVRGLAGDRTVLLSWNPPADLAGGTLSSYRIEYQVGSGTDWLVHTASTGITATQQVIVNLVNGTSYRFRVAAITQLGVGVPSQATADVIPYTVPGAPLGLFAAAGNGTASLAWQPPAGDGGRRVVGYRIEASAQSGWYELVANTGTSTTTFTATGLVNGMTYLFRVAAINTAGAGANSVGSNPVIPAGRAAAPVQIFGTTGVGSIGLTWQAPTNTGGLPITSYVVRWSGDGGVTWRSSDTGGPSLSFTILAVASPSTTAVQVAAVTAAGRGAWSAAVAQPSAVSGLTARGLKGGSVQLAWVAPATNGGSPITGFTIAVSKNGKPWQTLTIADPSQTSILLTGLKRSARYRFRVQSMTEAWMGPWSQITRPVSPR